MSAGRRWPLELAQTVAGELAAALRPCCERLEIAGSIRRRKPDVGDVEIVYASKRVQTRDLFGTENGQYHEADLMIETLLMKGVLDKRRNVNGSTMWGLKNKLAVHVASGMPVDLFATDMPCFENYLVCRTGPGDLNTEIATRAKAMGLKWNPYGLGFTRLDSGGVFYVAREADVFARVGLPWMEPEMRGAWREVK